MQARDIPVSRLLNCRPLIKHDGQPQQRNDSSGHIRGTAIPSNLTRRRRKAPIFSCSGVCSGILRCAAETLLTSDMSAPRAKHVPAKPCEEMGLGSCLPRRYSFGGQLPCGRDKAARGVGEGVKDCGRMEDGSGELHSHDLVAHTRRLEPQGSAPRKLLETWRCFRDGRRGKKDGDVVTECSWHLRSFALGAGRQFGICHAWITSTLQPVVDGTFASPHGESGCKAIPSPLSISCSLPLSSPSNGPSRSPNYSAISRSPLLLCLDSLRCLRPFPPSAVNMMKKILQSS
ncbi:hypothetical protein HDK90DRAFT_21600 [Phyllosticta capitalensis]|uniref:Uncharacterized protein n=1 Tax=Phyllosticta capitalensis TaxID=121624 RepID=A0ABR1Z373_9PEZI